MEHSSIISISYKYGSHVAKVDYMTTLAGYIHWYLTDEKVLGIGDASGMFPVDVETKEYRQDIAKTFNQLFLKWDIIKIF